MLQNTTPVPADIKDRSHQSSLLSVRIHTGVQFQNRQSFFGGLVNTKIVTATDINVLFTKVAVWFRINRGGPYHL